MGDKPQATTRAVKLLITSSKESPELDVLDKIKDVVDVVAIGRNVDELSQLADEDWAAAEVLLNCGAPSHVHGPLLDYMVALYVTAPLPTCT
jgi:hypothetical protein